MKLVRPAGLSRKSGGFTRSFASGFDQINPVNAFRWPHPDQFRPVFRSLKLRDRRCHRFRFLNVDQHWRTYRKTRLHIGTTAAPRKRQPASFVPGPAVGADSSPCQAAATKDLRRRLADTGANTLYIELGSPWENGYCESFNSKLRDKFLNGRISYSEQGTAHTGRKIAPPLQHGQTTRSLLFALFEKIKCSA